ncbi:MAG: PepSY-associated TM helix domain-containing protein [Armatimonadota bacterium]
MSVRTAPKPQPAEASRPRPLRLKIASWLRWAHIYLSMFSLLIVLFFSATGITLNHPTWFAGSGPRETQIKGKIPAEWLAAGAANSDKVARLEIVEYLRKENGVRGALDEFRVDETECMVSFKSPSYSADTFIDRTTGAYQLTTIEEGAVAYLNDLHKGRHSGGVWSTLIDASAIFLVLISMTGLGLIFYLKRIRVAALLTATAGIVLVTLIARFLIP